GSTGVFRIERDGAGDSAGGAVDGFQRRVHLEPGIVHAFGVLEIERFRSGKRCADQTEGGEENSQLGFHCDELASFSLDVRAGGFVRNKNEAPAMVAPAATAATRKSTPGTNFF